mmetsp:Transcript_34698/g.81360  ORF Transcript_34698/g.81360 Transcript_34698/m.81360 type:complete len:264 (-) Transcript_34698:654-1445(-)
MGPRLQAHPCLSAIRTSQRRNDSTTRKDGYFRNNEPHREHKSHTMCKNPSHHSQSSQSSSCLIFAASCGIPPAAPSVPPATSSPFATPEDTSFLELEDPSLEALSTEGSAEAAAETTQGEDEASDMPTRPADDTLPANPLAVSDVGAVAAPVAATCALLSTLSIPCPTVVSRPLLSSVIPSFSPFRDPPNSTLASGPDPPLTPTSGKDCASVGLSAIDGDARAAAAVSPPPLDGDAPDCWLASTDASDAAGGHLTPEACSTGS